MRKSYFQIFSSQLTDLVELHEQFIKVNNGVEFWCNWCHCADIYYDLADQKINESGFMGITDLIESGLKGE